MKKILREIKKKVSLNKIVLESFLSIEILQSNVLSEWDKLEAKALNFYNSYRYLGKKIHCLVIYAVNKVNSGIYM